MKTYTEQISNRLNDLLVKTYDAEKGFKKAADHTDNDYLKSYFSRKARERYVFGNELKNELANYGHRMETSGSTTGNIHRTWMDIKSMFSNDNDEAMLEEAIRGEKAALSEYEEVLGEDKLPPSTATLISNQKNQIRNGLATIKSIEDLK